jgi:hypothetical protein
MRPDTELWEELGKLNKKTEALIERVFKKKKQTEPVSRELYTSMTVEVLWENLPQSYNKTTLPNSDSLWGSNIKRGIFTNGGSRLYIREVSQTSFYLQNDNTREVFRSNAPRPYFLWNFQTSITQRQYADKAVSMRSLGRLENGSHLVFREPFILEPMETLVVQCELLQYGPAFLTEFSTFPTSFVVNMNFSGYREGM